MVKFRPWFLLLPAVGLLAAVDLAPFFYVLYLSFHQWILTLSKNPTVFIGFYNYRFLVNDPEFLGSLVRGIIFTASCVIVQLLAGLFVALIIYRKFRGETIFKIILTLPLAIPPVAIGSMWKLLVYPSIGPIPYYLSKLGVIWDVTRSATTSIATTVLMDTWHWLPFSTLIILAGLTSVPRDILECASIDGVGGLRKLWYIILPLIKFELTLVILFRGMDAFRIFDEIWMLTGGGPGSATRYLSVSLYMLTLKGWDIGLGSAFSALFLYVIIVMSWLLYKTITRVSK